MNHGRAEGGGSGKARPDTKMGSELRNSTGGTSGYRRAMQRVMNAKRRRRDRSETR